MIDPRSFHKSVTNITKHTCITRYLLRKYIIFKTRRFQICPKNVLHQKMVLKGNSSCITSSSVVLVFKSVCFSTATCINTVGMEIVFRVFNGFIKSYRRLPFFIFTQIMETPIDIQKHPSNAHQGSKFKQIIMVNSWDTSAYNPTVSAHIIVM